MKREEIEQFIESYVEASEILLADDASEDGTWKWLQKIQKKFTKKNFLEKKRKK